MIDNECEKCGGKLEEIYYDIDIFLKRNLEVDINLKKPGPVRLRKGKIISYDNKSLNLLLLGNKFDDEFYENRVSCRVGFAREKHPSGRFYFDSEVLNYNEEKRNKLIITTPDYLVRKQERSAYRYPLKTDVKYRLADNIGNLLAGDQAEYNKGWTVDISKSGVLLMADGIDLEKIYKGKYIDLKIKCNGYNISTIGHIARVNNLDKLDKRVALGVEFLRDKSDNLELIDDLSKKITAF